MLANRFPMLLWWGPEYVPIYNDAYRPVLGREASLEALGHAVPRVLGRDLARPRPADRHAVQRRARDLEEDIELELNRHGFLEESHFTIAYSPVPDETAPRGIGGVLATVHEITEQVVGERRVEVLRDLGARAAEAKTAEDACALAAEMLARTRRTCRSRSRISRCGRRRARLAGAAGVERRARRRPQIVDRERPMGERAWPMAEALAAESMQVARRTRGARAAVRRGHGPTRRTGRWSADPVERAADRPAGAARASASARASRSTTRYATSSSSSPRRSRPRSPTLAPTRRSGGAPRRSRRSTARRPRSSRT